MADPTPTEAPLIQAFQNLTSGLADLLVNILALARHEAKTDAIELGKDVGAIALAAGLLVLGYLGLLVSAVLFAAWYAGVLGAGVCAFTLTLTHLGVGAYTLRGLVKDFKLKYYGLRVTGTELQRTKEWARQIPAQL